MTYDEASKQLDELGIPMYIKRACLHRYKQLPMAEYEMVSIELDSEGTLVIDERFKFREAIEMTIVEAKRITKE